MDSDVACCPPRPDFPALGCPCSFYNLGTSPYRIVPRNLVKYRRQAKKGWSKSERWLLLSKINMSNRLGLIPASSLTEEQRSLHDDLTQSIKSRWDSSPRSPQLFLDDGTLIGPYGILLHHPEAARQFSAMVKALQTIPGLSLYGREVAIAVAGSRSQAAYEQYAHHIIATQRAGITEAELHEIQAGRCPSTLTSEGKAVFELATALGKSGVLDQAVYDKAVDVLGRDGAAAAIHYTGFYSYVGVLLNGFDAKVPEPDGA